jgi:hypothetical protein
LILHGSPVSMRPCGYRASSSCLRRPPLPCPRTQRSTASHGRGDRPRTQRDRQGHRGRRHWPPEQPGRTCKELCRQPWVSMHCGSLPAGGLRSRRAGALLTQWGGRPDSDVTETVPDSGARVRGGSVGTERKLVWKENVPDRGSWFLAPG